MDDNNLIFELNALALAESYRTLEDDPRDAYYQASTIKTLREAAARLKELHDFQYSIKLQQKLGKL